MRALHFGSWSGSWKEKKHQDFLDVSIDFQRSEIYSVCLWQLLVQAEAAALRAHLQDSAGSILLFDLSFECRDSKIHKFSIVNVYIHMYTVHDIWCNDMFKDSILFYHSFVINVCSAFLRIFGFRHFGCLSEMNSDWIPRSWAQCSENAGNTAICRHCTHIVYQQFSDKAGTTWERLKRKMKDCPRLGLDLQIERTHFQMYQSWRIH